MPRTLRPLPVAICFSLLLHAAPFLSELWWPKPPAAPVARAKPPVQARLVIPDTVEFLPPEPAKPKTSAPTEKPPLPPVDRKPAQNPALARVDRKPGENWTAQLRKQFAGQQEAGLFYPESAIQAGLEGEVLVLVLLDSEGKVVAARVEEGSGHAELDAAALAAVRRLRALPADAPRETLLPIRFQLK